MTGESDTTPANVNPLEQEVWAALRACRDPELPLNIVDLGLIYGVEIEGARVDVRLTLTAPGCHFAGRIVSEIQNRLLELGRVEEANVDLVWNPPWTPARISPAGRSQLGFNR